MKGGGLEEVNTAIMWPTCVRRLVRLGLRADVVCYHLILIFSRRRPESPAPIGLGQLRTEQVFRGTDPVRLGKRAVGHI